MLRELENWTVDPKTGLSNSSPKYNSLCDVVERLIRDSAHSLIAGGVGQVVSLIVAQLAHVHGLKPSDHIDAGEIIFWYRNYKGEQSYRRVKPLSIRFGTSDWHKEPQWLMLADDLENNKRREFAMKDIQSVVGNSTIAL